MYVASGDPEILGLSIGDGYVYALGDATNLDNSNVELSIDVEHVSRSIVWLQPDHIVSTTGWPRIPKAASSASGSTSRRKPRLPAASRR